MHVNTVLLVGRIGKNGPKLSYASSGAPTCAFTLEVDEVSKTGDIFVLYLPIELWGQAEVAAETLEAGDEVMVSGKLKYKSVVDAKTQVKTSKLIVSSWGISQRQPAQDDSASGGSVSLEAHAEIVAPEPISAAPATKARRPRVPKMAQQAWEPANRN